MKFESLEKVPLKKSYFPLRFITLDNKVISEGGGSEVLSSN